MYVCICIETSMCTYVCIGTCTCTDAYIHHIHTCLFMSIYIYTCRQQFTSLYMPWSPWTKFPHKRFVQGLSEIPNSRQWAYRSGFDPGSYEERQKSKHGRPGATIMTGLRSYLATLLVQASIYSRHDHPEGIMPLILQVLTS